MRETYPVQNGRSNGTQGQVNDKVYLKAYEVYSYVYGAQAALLEGGCRGGFGTGELVAFLYASGFPQKEWRDRVNEAFHNMKHV